MSVRGHTMSGRAISVPDDLQLKPPSSNVGEEPLASAVAYVRDLQRDGRLLLRFVARRMDRPLGTAGFLAGAEPAPDGTELAAHVLMEDPERIARDRNRFVALAACIDQLSRNAAPATVGTIRLTIAYLRIAGEGSEPPADVASRARKLRWMMRLIIAIAVAATVTSVLLLANVDDGRRAMQQLQEVRRDLSTTTIDLSKLPDTAWIIHPGRSATIAQRPVDSGNAPTPFLGFCMKDDTDGWRQPSLSEPGARAQALCSSLYETALREALVFQRITAWNCRTHSILTLGGLLSSDEGPEAPCGSLPERPRDPMASDGSDWHRTEIRTAGTISVLTGFVLPLLLGCVGGCAYVLRRLGQKLSDWTLEVRDGSHSLLRVLLATMLGGLLGVVWSGDQPVQLGGFALSLAAAAFFVGFALEVVFTIIEAMVDGVSGKLRPLPQAAPVAQVGSSSTL
jgi:hypothetical protein